MDGAGWLGEGSGKNSNREPGCAEACALEKPLQYRGNRSKKQRPRDHPGVVVTVGWMRQCRVGGDKRFTMSVSGTAVQIMCTHAPALLHDHLISSCELANCAPISQVRRPRP